MKTPQCPGKLEVQVSFKQELMSGEMHTMEQRVVFCLSKPSSLLEEAKGNFRQEIREGDALGKSDVPIYS